MTPETLITRNPYPQIKTLEKATQEALEISGKFPHIFVYVRLSTTTGLYSVDLIGNPYSDSKIVNYYLNQKEQ